MSVKRSSIIERIGNAWGVLTGTMRAESISYVVVADSKSAPLPDSPVEPGTSGLNKEDEPILEPCKDVRKDAINDPQIRVETSLQINENSFIAGVSMQGRSHIGAGIPCQDFHSFTTLAEGWYLAITSDGAGSARESARGSKANCELAVKLIGQLIQERKWIEENYLPDDKEWYIEIRNIFEMIQSVIIRKFSNPDALADSDDDKALEPRDFNATLILVLLTPRGMLTAHIGDGRMGYLSSDNQWIALMTPHKGDEACETVFLPNNWNRQMRVPAFTMSEVYLPDTKVIQELPKAVVLMSDGCENFTWKCTAYDSQESKYYDPNIPFGGFLNPLIDEMLAIEDCERRVERMIEIINIGTPEARREQDDRTFLLGVFDKKTGKEN